MLPNSMSIVQSSANQVRNELTKCLTNHLAHLLTHKLTNHLTEPRLVAPVSQDSSWALDRRPLETSKPPGVGEILLSNDGEALLEGMLTNFFVVRRGKDATNRASLNPEGQRWTAGGNDRGETDRGGAAESIKAGGLLTRQQVAATHSSDSLPEAESAGFRATGCEGERDFWEGLVVQTASLEEGVLPGVIRQEVLRWFNLSLYPPRVT